MNYRTMLVTVAFALILTACSQPTAQTPAASPAATTAPTTDATVEPTTVATTAATTEPTVVSPAVSSPTPAGILPAPLLFTDEGNQLVRLDGDGKTRTTLAHESATIIQFDRSLDGSTIAYITVDEDQHSTLIRIGADGSNRTELARGTIRGLTVATNGSVQAGMLFDSTAADGTALQDGTWSFSADGGAPALLVASTEPEGATPGTHYQPTAWSADGMQLLLTLNPNNGPDGPEGDISSRGWALYDRSNGQTRELLSIGQEPLCISPAWSRASDAIYCANGGAVAPPTPALWRLSLADGVQQTLIEGNSDPLTLVLAPADLADGLYVMTGESSSESQHYMPQRIGSDGKATSLLSAPIEAGYDGGLWSTDGSGVVVGVSAAGGNRGLVWQPFGSGEAVELVNGSIGQILWASE
ncbi:MAG: hypothetical protein HGA19_12840 [Oscillochloris sp.]|nr:hypothetical protein [Oscillochloris sp.]